MEDDAIGINETVFANYTNQTDVENTVIDEVSIIISLYKLVSICCLKLKILIPTDLIRFFFIGKLDIGQEMVLDGSFLSYSIKKSTKIFLFEAYDLNNY